MVEPSAELRRGRRSYAEERWTEAHASLSAADLANPLEAEDVERLATAAYMLGREAGYLEALERAHRAHREAADEPAALRCAFWIGVTHARNGEMGAAGGWLSRARRLLERAGEDRVERGYLLLPAVFEHESRGDWEAAATMAAEATAIAEAFGDADLFALAVHEHGHILIKDGRIREGLGLLDEAMVAVTTGDVSPIVSGITYCGVILACQDAFEVRRAGEWTAALSDWCERQPDLVAFTGRCLVHRAEIMQLHGTWGDALEEARRATERCLEGENPDAAGEACYREGEIHRLAGDFATAEDSYRKASRLGRQPQPGLALMRLAQGNRDAAEAAIRRACTEASDTAERARQLPAFVEIMLAAGDLAAARSACGELASIATGQESDALEAMAAHARGAVELVGGHAQAALSSLREAAQGWQRLDAPYELARTRELVGLACRAFGDEDTAALELEAARDAYADLGAAPDRARVDSLRGAATGEAHGLTGRELEVLRHLAAGESNKAIAEALVLSERTVERHVSNIFAKLGVSSRAAATAFAYEHGLV